MGSDRFEEEGPIHPQTISQPFWIGRFPVTNRQWRAAVETSGGAVLPPNWAEPYNTPGKEDHAIVGVSLFDAQRLIGWLGPGWNLPTEAEWEYAARGPEGFTYPWGNTWEPEHHLYFGGTGKMTDVVGRRPGGASWVGTEDMIGHVAEWTLDPWAPYPFQAARPEEPFNPVRVARGGSWNPNLDGTHAVYRMRINADFGANGIGLRLTYRGSQQ